MASFKSRAGSVNVGDNATLLIVGGGLALAYFGLIKPALDAGKSLAESLNLKDTVEEKEEKKAIVQNEKANGWNPNYYRSLSAKVQFLLPTQATAIRFCRDIFESAGFWNDDEERIYGVLRKIPSQAHLSFVAETFYTQHKQGLYDFLKNTLDWQSEMATVAKIINPLPAYIKPAKK